MPLCSSCGTANPVRARFCLACGTAFEAEGPPQEQRKTVTFVFCDLIRSTSLGERLDSESLKRVLTRYYATMRSSLERHGGTVEKYIGDAVVAVFGIPTQHEDDALRAVRAAADMHSGLAELNEVLTQRWGVELNTRMGVNTGEVVSGDPSQRESFAVGDAVNVAARLEQAAPPGGILLGPATYRLVRDAVTAETVEPLELKGKAEPLAAYRLVIPLEAPGLARRLDSPLVGRERELTVLASAFELAVQERRCEVATVLGEAGVGKSRLTKELIARLEGRARTLHGRCLPYGEGITLSPLSDVVKQAAGIRQDGSPAEAQVKLEALLPDDDDSQAVAARLGAALGLSEGASTSDDTFWATRKLFAALANERPLIVVFDDVQWAEPTFLDLLDYLRAYSRGHPLFLLLLARPELCDTRPVLAGSDSATAIVLERLTEGESQLLLTNLLGEARLAEDVMARVVNAAQGNPLFVEEFLRMLIDDGLLSREAGYWRAVNDLTQTSIPPTIQALLGARLDRLSPDERRVIEPAAVIGQEFRRDAVSELVPQAVRREVKVHLAALTRKELIRPTKDSFARDEAFTFSHMLVRDVAYGGLLKEARAELHEHFAAWLEQRAGKRIAEYHEILGYHLEQAYRSREALAPVDESGRRLARRAAERLMTAGRRAFAHADMPAAGNLFERAVPLLSTAAPERLELMIELGMVLFEVGQPARADSLLREAQQSAAAAGDRRIELHAILERSFIELYTDSDLTTGQLLRIASGAAAAFEECGDQLGVARAWHLIAETHVTVCHGGPSVEAFKRALTHAQRAGDAREEAQLLSCLATAHYWGPTPVEHAIRHHEEVLKLAKGRRYLEANLSYSLACLQAMRGCFAEARELCRTAAVITEELGLKLGMASAPLYSGQVEMLAGDPAAAEDELRCGYDLLSEMSEKGLLSTVAAFLADAIYTQGRYEEAERFTRASKEAAAGDDILSQVSWRATLSKLLAHRGDLKEAEGLAREAGDLAAHTDYLNLRGDAAAALAEVLCQGDRQSEAVAALQLAFTFYEDKGNVVSARKARDQHDELIASPAQRGLL